MRAGEHSTLRWVGMMGMGGDGDSKQEVKAGLGVASPPSHAERGGDSKEEKNMARMHGVPELLVR